MKLFLVH